MRVPHTKGVIPWPPEPPPRVDQNRGEGRPEGREEGRELWRTKVLTDTTLGLPDLFLVLCDSTPIFLLEPSLPLYSVQLGAGRVTWMDM